MFHTVSRFCSECRRTFMVSASPRTWVQGDV
jgi:hypothetical protein